MGFLSIGPRIRKENDQVVLRTGYCVRMLTFGTIFREVTIDPKLQKVYIQNRWFWFFGRKRSVGFKKILHITYGYADVSFRTFFTMAHDAIDSFSIGLRFVDDSEMRLFTYYGEGSFTNNSMFPDWLYWEEYATDLTGSQEKESRALIDLLCAMIGVSVIPPRH